MIVDEVAISGQRNHFGDAFPSVLRLSSSGISRQIVREWIQRHRCDIFRKLSVHGAILFRGFPVSSPEDFDAFVAAFGVSNFPYDSSLSNAVRVNLTERVFTANEAPNSVCIHLHHEMAQTPIYPGRLFFYCQHPAITGGATPICRSDVLYQQLRTQAAGLLIDCERKGLRYTNVMPLVADSQSGMGRSWKSTLNASDKAGAEAKLTELGYEWKWLDDGSLRATTPVLPAVHKLPSERKSFFNQLIAAARGWKDRRNDPSRSVTLGDGSQIDQEAVAIASEVAEQLSFDIAWKSGDVALVDNLMVMHGRRTFQGNRRVLASLVSLER